MSDLITDSEFVEAIASIWRDMGQPGIAGYTLVVDEALGITMPSVIGVPIAYTAFLADLPVQLAYKEPEDLSVRMFNRYARDYY